MSEKPAFVRCPYCQHRLDKIPTRKTKCPDCGKPIYVRAGDLLREDELEKPSGATAARPRRPKSSGGDTAAKSKKKRKPAAQADQDKEPRKPRKKRKTLASDMRRKKRETFSRRDLDGGIQLLLGIVGKLLAGGNFMDVVGGLLGGMVGGNTASAGDRLAASGLGADQITAAADDIYDTLGEDEQRQLRAVVAWAQNGFDLGDRLTD